MSESLSLKWGTLKSWELAPGGAALEALRRYHEHPVMMSALMQRDTPEQKHAICEIIDALDADTVYLEWDDKHVSKAEAKAYVLEYPEV